ncbi:hypothetical protein WKW77_08010 [Variovorax ureilyticus]|uniref:Uncharacterized protein n=1 Tax=Variovorax ureilyticus TaxID=1836198 RepID=A0ABU8VDC2_9BURK
MFISFRQAAPHLAWAGVRSSLQKPQIAVAIAPNKLTANDGLGLSGALLQFAASLT